MSEKDLAPGFQNMDTFQLHPPGNEGSQTHYVGQRSRVDSVLDAIEVEGKAEAAKWRARGRLPGFEANLAFAV